MRYLCFGFAVAFAIAASATVQAADKPFLSPAVQSEMDAIGVAHALFTARMHTQPMATRKDEPFWQKNFSAKYSNGVWVVTSKSQYSDGVAGVSVQIAAQDGRLLGLVFCKSAGCPVLPVPASAPVGDWSYSR